MIRFGFGGAAICIAIWVPPLSAQQFDDFGGSVIFEEFEAPPEGITLPSLSEGGIIPDNTDLQLGDTGTGDENDDATFFPGTETPVTSVSQPQTRQARRATLRALDKTIGRPTDIDLAVGESVVFGRIAIQLIECRFPAEDAASDAYANVRIFDLEGNALFQGWMVSSSPALNALEHPRYDVWVLNCGRG